MKKIFLLLGLSLFVLQHVIAQKEFNEVNSQKRTIGAFHGIEASSGIEVYITKGDQEELAVSVGNLDYLKAVKTKVSKEGILVISRESNGMWNTWKNWKVRVYVSYTGLTQLEANSGSSITGTGVQLAFLKAEANSGGMIKLSGKADMLDVETNSGGNFKGNELEAMNCKADASSGGNMQLYVTKELSAEANSGGSIKYRGEGLIKNISTGSGGSIKKQQ
jgi:hypothetical protein